MAKKSKKKSSTRGRARKPAAKRRTASLAPKPVKTGRGASPAEIGADLVAMFNRGELKEIERKHWSPRITSVEGVGVALAWEGKRAVDAKNAGWTAANTVHAASAEGPYAGASGFAVKFSMDVEEKATGKRTQMQEIGVYTVQNGKIVREEFMYYSGA